MKLVAMRHGKAEAEGHGADKARKLTEQGRADAASVGRQLVESGNHPSVVMVSSAVRTRQTFDALPPELSSGANVRMLDELYNVDLPGLLALIAREDTVMVIGHNPTISALVAFLVGPENLPTPSMKPSDAAVIEAEQIEASKGQLLAYVRSLRD